MGTTERRQRERGQMHDIIIDAAVELFLAEGYEQTSMRKIAQKIEYTPGAIYSYFKDKDEILYEIHLRGFTKLFEMIRVALDEKDPLDKLYKTGQLYIRFALENPQYYDLMFINRSIPRSCYDKKEWEPGKAAHNVLVQIITECIEKKLLPEVDILAAAYAFWSLVHGMVSLILCGRYLPPEHAEIDNNKPSGFQMPCGQYLPGKHSELLQDSYDFIWNAIKNKK